eukprot:TRINITY_DN74903_c0_g1_i1.p1 TRINITY_DN74903_c0_g1~~TRINITY_DN74903_c0_g1_i1.p1  ORF type:complete len:349 (+),score=96.70 TRINITY_DN74903_c0_g1_i1:80-1126(+)
MAEGEGDDGVNLEDSMSDVYALVSDPGFRAEMLAFLEMHCDEFEVGIEENKLVYTEIHNKYCELIEVLLARHLGSERRDAIVAALEKFLEAHGGDIPDEVSSSLGVFAPLWDFEAFRIEIIAVKAQKNAREASPMPAADSAAAAGPGRPAFSVEDALQRLEGLLEAGTKQGWQRFMKTPTLTGDVQRHGEHKCALRITIAIDLGVEEAVEMLTSVDMPLWMSHLRGIDVVAEDGPGSRLTRVSLQPTGESYVARTVVKADLPSAGSMTYVTVPWDLERDIGMEELGPHKVKAGVCRPDGGRKSRCLLTTLDHSDLGDLPTADLKNLIGSRMSKVPSIVARYKEVKGRA